MKLTEKEEKIKKKREIKTIEKKLKEQNRVPEKNYLI